MTETPLTAPIDMSSVAAADGCPHYITAAEAEQGAHTCAWCSLRVVRTFGRPGVSGPSSSTRRAA